MNADRVPGRPQADMGIYAVELLYHHLPELELPTLAGTLRRELPSSQLDTLSGGGFMVIHAGDVVRFTDSATTAMTAVMPAAPGVDPGRYAEALAQTWGWRDEARTRLARCTHQVLVTDLMSRKLPPRRRIELVLGVVRAVCAAAAPLVLHWLPASRLKDPADLADVVSTSVNARLFTVNGSDGEMVMDTLGLVAVGLPDVQVRFQDLEPGTVAGWLLGVAGYLLAHGDVIGDGHTIEGIPKGARWRCRHEASLIPPERVVVNAEPDAPYRAEARPA